MRKIISLALILILLVSIVPLSMAQAEGKVATSVKTPVKCEPAPPAKTPVKCDDKKVDQKETVTKKVTGFVSVIIITITIVVYKVVETCTIPSYNPCVPNPCGPTLKK